MLVFRGRRGGGTGAYALIQSGAAKKAAVTVVGKGMELQEKVAAMAERVTNPPRTLWPRLRPQSDEAAPAQA